MNPSTPKLRSPLTSTPSSFPAAPQVLLAPFHARVLQQRVDALRRTFGRLEALHLGLKTALVARQLLLQPAGFVKRPLGPCRLRLRL